MSSTLQIVENTFNELLILQEDVQASMDNAAEKVKEEIQKLKDDRGRPSTKSVLRLASVMDRMCGQMQLLKDNLDSFGGSFNEVESTEDQHGSEAEAARPLSPSLPPAEVTRDQRQNKAMATVTDFLQLQAHIQSLEDKIAKCRPELSETLPTRIAIWENLRVEGAKKVTAFGERLDSMDRDKAAHGEQLNTLVSGMDDLRAEVDDNAKKRSEIADDMDKMQDELAAVNLHVSELKSVVEDNSQKLGVASLLMQALNTTSDSDSPMPAFAAKLTNTCLLKHKTRIYFKTVIHNKHGCYDPSTGIFKAPVDGTYLFSTSFNNANKPARNLALAISCNDKDVALCGGNCHNGQQATTAILLLAKDDQVWVETDNCTNSEGVEVGSGFCNFTGCRLH